MVNGNSQENEKWLHNMHLLKWAAIMLPIVFLAVLDLLRHTIFYGQLHTLQGFITIYAVVGLAVVIFSFSIFGFNTRLQRKVVEQNREFLGLINIAEATAANPRIEELLDVSLDHILSSLKVEAGLICLLDMEKEEHSAVCYRNLPQELICRIQRAKIKDDSIVSEVIRTGKPEIIERAFEDPRVAEAAKQLGIKSSISAPLKSEGKVNGILVIATRQEHHFSDADRHFLDSIGDYLGMAIKNAEIYQQTKLQNRELGALLAVGKTVTSSFDLGELLSKLLDTIIEVMHIEAAEIWLMDEQEELTMSCHRGSYREAFLERTRFRMGEGIPGLVAQKREPILVHNLPDEDRFLRKEVIRAGFHTLCALPLFYQTKLTGVLLVAALSVDAVKSQRELRLLEGIGEWLAIGVENAHLYQQVQDMAAQREREGIARDLHDGFAQLLGYFNTQTMAVKKFLSDGQLTRALKELTKMGKITRDMYADVREGILGLRTMIIREDGLLSILRQYAERYEEMTDIKVEFNVTGIVEDSRLPPPVEIQLTRIVQEALSNVRKHAKATEVKVALERNDGEIRVAIADNGRGFESTRLPLKGQPHFGLQTMRERAEALGGRFVIESVTGQGTRVEVHIPLAQLGINQVLSL